MDFEIQARKETYDCIHRVLGGNNYNQLDKKDTGIIKNLL